MWGRGLEARIQRAARSAHTSSSKHLGQPRQRGLQELSGEPVEPIVIKPAVPFQRNLGNWLQWFLVRENWAYPDLTAMVNLKSAAIPGWDDLRRLPLRAFLMTYEVDGFDFTSAKFTYANDPQPKELNSAGFSKWLLVATFFGLPTRPRGRKEGDKVLPSLSFKELLQNFIGGWIPLYHYENQKDSKTGEQIRIWDINEKAIWQLLSLPIKFLVILPLNILRVFTKTTINIIKLFTEFLPMFLFPLVRVLATAVLTIAAGIVVIIPILIAYLSWKPTEQTKSRILTFALRLLIGLPITLPCVLFCLAVGITAFVSGVVANYSIRLLQIVARAIFSPEKSARMAFTYGRELRGKVFGFNIGNAMGVILAAISLAITVVAWTIIFPILIGAIAGYFPALMQMITGIMQWPLVAASLNAIQSGLTIIGTALTAVFGPAITTISAFLGIHLSAAVIAFGATVGLFAAPVVTIGSRIKDELANWWVSRHEGGPVTWMLSCFRKSSTADSKEKQATGVGDFKKYQLKAQLKREIEENKEKLAILQQRASDPSSPPQVISSARQISQITQDVIKRKEAKLAELEQFEKAADQAHERAIASGRTDDVDQSSSPDVVPLLETTEEQYEWEL